MTMIKRLWTHLFSAWFQVNRHFPEGLLAEIAEAIRLGEQQHNGEVQFVIEPRLSFGEVLAGIDSRTRAKQVFAEQGVWDTEHNNGILIYLLLAEHRVEIVADRGIARHVEQAKWDEICQMMCQHFAQGAWQQGSLDAIAEVNRLLSQHIANQGENNPNELDDRPMVL